MGTQDGGRTETEEEGWLLSRNRDADGRRDSGDRDGVNHWGLEWEGDQESDEATQS